MLFLYHNTSNKLFFILLFQVSLRIKKNIVLLSSNERCLVGVLPFLWWLSFAADHLFQQVPLFFLYNGQTVKLACHVIQLTAIKLYYLQHKYTALSSKFILTVFHLTFYGLSTFWQKTLESILMFFKNHSNSKCHDAVTHSNVLY